MGLDQYAYIANKQGHRAEWYDGAEFNKETNEFENPNITKPQEIAYWRKHPNLQGWMEKLWLRKNGYPTDNRDQFIQNKQPLDDFNGVELELTWDDVDKLEKDIKAGSVAKLGTKGFFFGDPSDDYYRKQDLQFCIDAKAELFLGRKVFYNSSW
jgi:hypothetical protein